MKYFTRELLLERDTDDIDRIVASDLRWEEASERYGEELGSYLRNAPECARRLADEYLHDGEILLSPTRRGSDVFAAVVAAGVALFIVYRDATLSVDPPRGGWTMQSDPMIWLYDEIRGDPADVGLSTHSILLSDGVCYRVSFRDVRLQKTPLS